MFRAERWRIKEKNVERTRVIIVDDEALIRMDLKESLTNQGYLVIGDAGDGRSGINLARKLNPDIVIMDIKMPDLDGIEAARILTEERIAPVLLLSAYSQQELLRRATQAGVAGYLVKPFRESDLAPAIEVALARFNEFREIEREIGNLQETLEARKVVERAKGILMESQGLSEAEAFRKIQKMSMNNRRTMRAVADAIILAHQAGEH
jgi:response regulator NasT